MEFRKLIAEICQEENIEYDLISKDWVMILTKNGITKCISGYQFSLNDHALGKIIDDKYAFYDLCKIKKIPIIEHRILFRPDSKLGMNTNNLLEKYFQEYNCDVVIKPNSGSEGIDVFHITNVDELKKKVTELFKANFSISICPFYSISKEYRVVVLNSEIKLIYEKNKAVVIGDGKKTIKELLLELNSNYFKKLKLNNNYDRVLEENEIFEYDWRFNLSKGATAKLISDKDLYEKLSMMAIDVCKKLGAKFVTVDIIDANDNFYILETNSGVCINKVCNFIDKDYKIAKQIYREAILSMFKQ